MPKWPQIGNLNDSRLPWRTEIPNLCRRILGARIGHGAYIIKSSLACSWDLLSVGEGAILDDVMIVAAEFVWDLLCGLLHLRTKQKKADKGG